MDDATERAQRWLTDRLASSLLIQHYFELRTKGLDADAGVKIVGALTETYVLGRCAVLASVAAEIVGRDRMVSFMHADGHLLHAVVACTPQAVGEPLRGDCVDILGRERLEGMKGALEAALGPVSIMIGEMVDKDELRPGERERLFRIFAALPWLRKALLVPASDQPPVQLFEQMAEAPSSA